MADYKSLKEAFVSGTTGSSVTHVNMVSAVALVYIIDFLSCDYSWHCTVFNRVTCSSPNPSSCLQVDTLPNWMANSRLTPPLIHDCLCKHPWSFGFDSIVSDQSFTAHTPTRVGDAITFKHGPSFEILLPNSHYEAASVTHWIFDRLFDHPFTCTYYLQSPYALDDHSFNPCRRFSYIPSFSGKVRNIWSFTCSCSVSINFVSLIEEFFFYILQRWIWA